MAAPGTTPNQVGETSFGGPSYGGYSQYYAAPPQAVASTTVMEITASAKNIPKMDGLLGKADPYLVVTVGEGETKRLVFRSEVVRNSLNPSWKPFSIDLAECGGEDVPLLWSAYDWDPDGGHDFIGSFTATLGQVEQQPKFIFMNPARRSTFGKPKPQSGEFLVASCRRAVVPAKVLPRALRIVFRGEKLSKKDLFSSDPFLILYGTPYPTASGLPPHIAWYQEGLRRQAASASAPGPSTPTATPAAASGRAPPVLIAKTEVIKKNVNPTWSALELPLELTGGLTAPMTIVCCDFNSDGTHAEIGRCVASLKTLSSPDPLLPLINPERRGVGGYQNSGLLRVSSVEEVHGYPEHKPLAYDFSVSMRKLARMDFGGLGKCDPFIHVSARLLSQPDPSRPPDSRDLVVFKSEIIPKTLSPVFKPFQLSVLDCGGMDNRLLFQVFDKDPKGQELVGDFSTSLRELTMPQFNQFHLRNPKHFSSTSGRVTINSATPCFTLRSNGQHAHAYTITAGARKLERASTAFIIRNGKDGPLILNGSLAENTKNPDYQPFVLEAFQCGGIDGPLYFEFSDYQNPGRPSFIGAFTTSLRELNMFQSSPSIPIIDPKKIDSLGYKSSGDFVILDVQPLAPHPSSIYSTAPPAYPPPSSSFSSDQQQPEVDPQSSPGPRTCPEVPELAPVSMS